MKTLLLALSLSICTLCGCSAGVGFKAKREPAVPKYETRYEASCVEAPLYAPPQVHLPSM